MKQKKNGSFVRRNEQDERHRGSMVIDRATDGYQRIRDLIVHGHLAPGTRIIESDLARRLELSRTPVRSALDRLRQEGYVMRADEGRRGPLSVAPLTQEDAAELLNIVGEVEGLAAWYAAGLDEGRVQLVNQLTERNRALADAATLVPRDGTTYYELDLAFHETYVYAAHRPRVLALFRAVRPQAERYIRMYTTALVGDIDTSVKEHEAIIATIRAGNQDAAQRAVRTNYRCAAERLSQVIDVVGERGSW